MAKFLLTGRQGCGKTTAIKLLAQNGFAAFNTDDIEGATCLENKQTGEVIKWPESAVDWSVYAWNWQRNVIEEMLAKDDDVFLGGVVSNQKDFYPLFDKVFVLMVSRETLEGRLRQHEHASHHLPGVIERILTNHEAKQQAFIDDGGIPVDANRPTTQIAQEILGIAGIKKQLQDF